MNDAQEGALNPNALARAAGALYLVIIAAGVWTEAVVRGSIRVREDAAATAANLIANEGLFRMGFATEMVMGLADVGVALLLFFLLRVVSKPLAMAAAVFHLVSTAVLSANTLTAFGALLLMLGNAGGTFAPAPFEAREAEALVALFFNWHTHGYSVALVFFAVNCLALGWLIHRAKFLPSVLGWLMAAAGLVYLVTSFTRFLAPEHYGAVVPGFLICLLAEGTLALWLVVRGVDDEKWRASTG